MDTNNNQMNYWICWNEANAEEPCFLCNGDPSEVLYEEKGFSFPGGDTVQIPVPKREFDELHSAKLFEYRELWNGLFLAHVKYLGEGFINRSDGFMFKDPDYVPMCGVITKEGSIVIPFSYTDIYFDRVSHLYHCNRIKNWKALARNEQISHSRTENGELIIEYDNTQILVSKYYDDYQVFSEGLCAVRKCSPNYPDGYGWGFVNTKGVEVIPCKPEYRSVSDFHEGFSIVKKIKGPCDSRAVRYNYISSDGVELLDCDVYEASPFSNERARIRTRTSELTINKEGLVLFPTDGQDAWGSIDELKD